MCNLQHERRVAVECSIGQVPCPTGIVTYTLRKWFVCLSKKLKHPLRLLGVGERAVMSYPR